MKKFIVVLVALLALVVFMPQNYVNAIEKTQIETLDCDLDNIIDVDFEIAKTINPIMIVEVEISFGNHYEGLQDNTNVYYTTNCSYKARFNDFDNSIEEVKPYSMFYDTYRYEQVINNKDFLEPAWYCTNNCYSMPHMAMSERTTTANYTKSRMDDDRLKFCNLYEEVGITTGVIQDLRI